MEKLSAKRIKGLTEKGRYGDGDNFVRNAVTILAEGRIVLTVRPPRALIYGDYSGAQG